MAVTRLRPAPAAMAALLAARFQSEADCDTADDKVPPDEVKVRLAACQNGRGKLAAIPADIKALAADSAAASQTFWTVSKPAPRVQDPGKL